MTELDVDMTAFLATEQKEPVVITGKTKKTKKKRDTPYSKKGGDTELQDMRAQAKSLCKSFEQYRSVSKYKKERLRDWLEQKQFDSDAALQETVFSFAHTAYAYAVDFLTKGGGHVKDRLSNDLTLRTAIEDEGRDMVKWLTNKSKIAFLTVSDTWEGKLEQRSVEKQKEPAVIEEILEYGATGTEETNADHNEARENDILGQQQATTTEEQVLSVSVGEEEMQETAEAVPSTDTIEAALEFDLREEGERENTLDSETVEEQQSVV
jgi:hypothetical protein